MEKVDKMKLIEFVIVQPPNDAGVAVQNRELDEEMENDFWEEHYYWCTDSFWVKYTWSIYSDLHISQRKHCNPWVTIYNQIVFTPFNTIYY